MKLNWSPVVVLEIIDEERRGGNGGGDRQALHAMSSLKMIVATPTLVHISLRSYWYDEYSTY